MQKLQNIFLPGGFKVFRILRNHFHFADRTVLLIGAGSEMIAEKILHAGAKSVKMIVDNFDSLMNAKLSIKNKNQIDVRMMDFHNTDFNSDEFDLIYAQASISSDNRNKIVKEIKRILKQEGTFCVGEITVFTKTYPTFVRDIFSSSEIVPLNHDECSKYYQDHGFKIYYEQDLSSSLKNFYENALLELEKATKHLTEQEKSYYKKLLNKISHESNAYLNLGADKYIGLKMLILKLSGSAS